MRYFSKKIRLFCLTLALLMAFAPSALAASGFRLNAQEQAMIEMVNSDRARYGRSALTLDLELCALAREKSSDMLNNNYFAHESPTLGSASDLLTANGVSFRSVGENIARYRSIEHAQAALLSSDGHRRNLLSRSYTHFGVGVALDENGFVYVTQLFVRR